MPGQHCSCALVAGTGAGTSAGGCWLLTLGGEGVTAGWGKHSARVECQGKVEQGQGGGASGQGVVQVLEGGGGSSKGCCGILFTSAPGSESPTWTP